MTKIKAVIRVVDREERTSYPIKVAIESFEDGYAVLWRSTGLLTRLYDSAEAVFKHWPEAGRELANGQEMMAIEFFNYRPEVNILPREAVRWIQ